MAVTQFVVRAEGWFTILGAESHAAAVLAAQRRAAACELPVSVHAHHVAAATVDDVAEYRSARGL